MICKRIRKFNTCSLKLNYIYIYDRTYGYDYDYDYYILFLLLIISTVYYLSAGIWNFRQYNRCTQTLGSVPTFTRLHLKCRSVGRAVLGSRGMHSPSRARNAACGRQWRRRRCHARRVGETGRTTCIRSPHARHRPQTTGAAIHGFFPGSPPLAHYISH